MKRQVVTTNYSFDLPIKALLSSATAGIVVEGSILYLTLSVVGLEGSLLETVEPFDIDVLYRAILGSLRNKE